MRPLFIITHTVAKRGLTSYAEIDGWHRTNGWDGFGYHCYIRKDGTRIPGRAYNRPGAHCKDMGMNSKSLGVCLEGHGNFEEWTPEQTASYNEWVLEQMAAFNIPVTNILGHRETGAKKDCPGLLINMDIVRENLLKCSLT